MNYKFYKTDNDGNKIQIGDVRILETGETNWIQRNASVVNGLSDVHSIELVDDDNPEGEFNERDYSHWKILPFLLNSPYLWAEQYTPVQKSLPDNEWPDLIKVDFDETKHPRDKGGEFAPKGEGGTGGGHDLGRKMPKRIHMGGGRFKSTGDSGDEPAKEPEAEKKPTPAPVPPPEPEPVSMATKETEPEPTKDEPAPAASKFPEPEEGWHEKSGKQWDRGTYETAKGAVDKGLSWERISPEEIRAQVSDNSEFRGKREEDRWTVRYLVNGKVMHEVAHSKNKDLAANRLVGKGEMDLPIDREREPKPEPEIAKPEPAPVKPPPPPEPAPEPKPEPVVTPEPEKERRKTIPTRMKRDAVSFHKYPDDAEHIHNDFHSDPGWNKWMSKLTRPQKKAIQRYIGKRGEGWVAEAEEVNRILRSKGDYGPYEDMINGLDQALNSGELHKDMILYRAASSSKPDRFDAIANGTLKVGGTLSDDGFISTSPKYGTATLERFLNPRIKPYPILYRIKAPKGTKGAYVSWSELDNPYMQESEFLMPRGTKFTIEKMGYEQVNGKRTAVLDLRVGE